MDQLLFSLIVSILIIIIVAYNLEQSILTKKYFKLSFYIFLTVIGAYALNYEVKRLFEKVDEIIEI